MTKKSCFTCSFMCEKQPNHKLKTVPHNHRHKLVMNELSSRWVCYFEQWENGLPNSGKDTSFVERLRDVVNDDDIAIKISANYADHFGTSGNYIILTKHSCKHYHRFDPHSTISADRLAEDRKIEKENYRFLWTIILSIVTTISVTFTAFISYWK